MRAQRHAARAAAATETLPRQKVPLELEDGDLPLNTFSPKKPFKGKVMSVEKITGPKATGETCNIVIETNGDIPYWEGQSYGVVPPVRALPTTPSASSNSRPSMCGAEHIDVGCIPLE